MKEIFLFNVFGIVFMVFKFSVTSSPSKPSPLVEPLINFPFSYSKETERPSTFGSTMYAIFSILSFIFFFEL